VSYPRAAASRDVLIGIFWPTLDVQTAAHRLHIAVAGARAAIRELCPEVDGLRCAGSAYGWNSVVRIDCDVDHLLAASRSRSLDAMKEAAALYAGEYLAGEDAEWMYPLRLRCANAYATILERLSESAMGREDYLEALDYGLRLLETDRAHEGATELVMRSFAASGRRGAALAAYDALAAYLQHHLALKPCARMNQLRNSIIDG